MHAEADVLGDEGRNALDVCVKIKVYGKRGGQVRYCWDAALRRLGQCLGLWNHDELSFLLPEKLGVDGKTQETYDITEIYDALVKADNMPYVQKHPGSGPL